MTIACTLYTIWFLSDTIVEFGIDYFYHNYHSLSPETLERLDTIETLARLTE
jgi:hypothetical protein